MRKHRFVACSLCIGLSICGTPAAAGQHSGNKQADIPSPNAEQDIVVIGSKPTSRTTYNFTNALTVDTEGQIARFVQPICPASFGLPKSYNRVIEQRLREDAMRVGLRTAGDKCDANIVVIIAADPSPLIKMLQRRRPQMFTGVDFARIEEVLKTRKPVRTWQTIEPRATDGRPLQRVAFLGKRPIGGNGAWVNSAPANSRIQQNTRRDLVSSFVIIDVDAIDGLSLTQIADYAAMRTLARTRSGSALHRQSIVGVIDGTDADRGVEQLTAWDLAYLRALYRTSNTVSAQMQQRNIAGAMDRDLQGSDR